MVDCDTDYGWCDEEVLYYPMISRDFEIKKEHCYEDYGFLYNIKTYLLKKRNMDLINEELMMKALSPKRLERHLALGGDMEDF